jgi:hypothetical protein
MMNEKPTTTMKPSTKIMLLSIAFFLMIDVAFGTNAPNKSQIHSMMMYNFMKYVEWPEEMKGDSFTVAVIGNKDVFHTMEKLYGSKKVGHQSLEFVFLTSVADLEQEYHMVYLGHENGNQFDGLKNKLQGKSTLIVTDGDALAAQGSAINFVMVNGHPKFEMNKAYFDHHGLKVSSALASLAILI